MIPAIGHFIWFGENLPWIHALGPLTASLRGGFARVVVHHADQLTPGAWGKELSNAPGVELRPLEPLSLLEGIAGVGTRLVDLYRRLTQPAARTNVVRAALLLGEGGVYLDTDTVTVASLESLRTAASCFYGNERIAFPGSVSWYRTPLRYAGALGRTTVRDACRRLPDGWRHFRRIEHWYTLAANNAILAASPGHPFMHYLVERMAAVPRWRQRIRFELGTNLLQAVLAEYRGGDVMGCDPEVFYPLAPEISEHWFRSTGNPRLEELLTPNTRVVHWYASVRTRQVVRDADREWVSRHAKTQLFSALVSPLLSPSENG